MTNRYTNLQKKLLELEAELNLIFSLPTKKAYHHLFSAGNIQQRFVFLKNLLSAETASGPSKPGQLPHIQKRLTELETAFCEWYDRRRSMMENNLDTDLDTASVCSCNQSYRDDYGVADSILPHSESDCSEFEDELQQNSPSALVKVRVQEGNEVTQTNSDFGSCRAINGQPRSSPQAKVKVQVQEDKGKVVSADLGSFEHKLQRSSTSLPVKGIKYLGSQFQKNNSSLWPAKAEGKVENGDLGSFKHKLQRSRTSLPVKLIKYSGSQYQKRNSSPWPVKAEGKLESKDLRSFDHELHEQNSPRAFVEELEEGNEEKQTNGDLGSCEAINGERRTSREAKVKEKMQEKEGKVENEDLGSSEDEEEEKEDEDSVHEKKGRISSICNYVSAFMAGTTLGVILMVVAEVMAENCDFSYSAPRGRFRHRTPT